MKINGLVAGAVLAAAAGVANADVLMYSVIIPEKMTNWAETVLLPQFDGSLGTLLSVELTADASAETEFFLENTSPAQAAYTASVQHAMAINGLGTEGLITMNDVAMDAGMLSGFDGTIDFDGTSGVSPVVQINMAGTHMAIEGSDDLTPYIGTGDLEFEALADAFAEFTLQGGNGIMGATHWTGVELTIAYTYEPVPAPASAALLGLGGLVATRRRR